ncbi:MAG: hypothetical protein V1778_04315, partial [bacterium]
DRIPNKTTETMKQYEQEIRWSLPFLSWAPLVFVSATTGQRVRDLLPLCRTIASARSVQLTDRSLERFMKHALKKRTPPRTNNVATRLISLTQIASKPPTFRVLIGPRQQLVTSYTRFLTNELRSYYHLEGTAIRLRVEQQLRR